MYSWFQCKKNFKTKFNVVFGYVILIKGAQSQSNKIVVFTVNTVKHQTTHVGFHKSVALIEKFDCTKSLEEVILKGKLHTRC